MKVELIIVSTIVQYVMPIFITSGHGHDYNKNNGQTYGSSLYNLGGRNNIGYVQSSEGYNNGGQLNNVNSLDGSRFDESSRVRVGNSDQNRYDQNGYQHDAGRQDYEVKKNVGHSKGHHKTGFHKSYCKDESGNNSSYYDDGHDEGNKYIYDGRNKNYDGSSAHQQQGQNFDNRYYSKDQGKHKLYGNTDNVYNDRGDDGYFNRKQYQNDALLYGKNKANDLYNRDGSLVQNRYYSRPYHTHSYDQYSYNDYPGYPHQSWTKHMPFDYEISIYDDPHYSTDEYRRNSYSDEYDRYRFGPYYTYDDEYYSPTREVYDHY